MEERNNIDQDYEEYLRQIPKEFLLTILENCYCEIQVYDKEGKILYANPSVISRYGISPEEVIFCYKNYAAFFKGRWFPALFPHCVEDKRTVFGEQRYLETGEILSSTCTPVFDETGEIKYVIGELYKHIERFDYSYKDNPATKTLKRKEENSNIVGRSYHFFKVLSDLKKAAKSDMPILLLGESGTGKSFLAEYIHKNSLRKEMPFLTINCTAIPENLLESELFGYERGAFTGASQNGKRGLFEMADGGTIFLDEIGELPLSIQVKLLDVLENKRFISIGGSKLKHVDVRIITATNKTIEEEVEKKYFREDLFWRINTYSIVIPPLRERRADILPMASYFLKQQNEKYHTEKIFSSEVVNILMNDPWKGNVRQLKNLIERLVVISKGNIIDVTALPHYMMPTEVERDEEFVGLKYLVSEYEREIVRYYYNKTKNMKEFMKKMKLSKSKAYALVGKYCEDFKKIK